MKWFEQRLLDSSDVVGKEEAHVVVETLSAIIVRQSGAESACESLLFTGGNGNTGKRKHSGR